MPINLEKIGKRPLSDGLRKIINIPALYWKVDWNLVKESPDFYNYISDPHKAMFFGLSLIINGRGDIKRSLFASMAVQVFSSYGMRGYWGSAPDIVDSWMSGGWYSDEESYRGHIFGVDVLVITDFGYESKNINIIGQIVKSRMEDKLITIIVPKDIGKDVWPRHGNLSSTLKASGAAFVEIPGSDDDIDLLGEFRNIPPPEAFTPPVTE